MVTIEADEECIAEVTGFLEVGSVAEVKNIEASVGGDESFALIADGLAPGGEGIESELFGLETER